MVKGSHRVTGPKPRRGGGNSWQASIAAAGASVFAPFSFHGLTPVAKRLCPCRGLCVCAVLILVARVQHATPQFRSNGALAIQTAFYGRNLHVANPVEAAGPCTIRWLWEAKIPRILSAGLAFRRAKTTLRTSV